MRKTANSLKKDASLHGGQFWIKKPSLNYRQSSGVEFRGEYVNAKAYLQHLRREAIIKGDNDER